MIVNIAIAAAACVFAALVGWACRRVLGTPVGWIRSTIVGLVVVVVGVPSGLWVAQSLGLVTPERTLVAGSGVIAVVVMALTLAWVFALGVAVLVGLEMLFPTTSFPNPIEVVRSALRRRQRTRRYLEILSIASRYGAGWIFHGRGARTGPVKTAEQRAEAIVRTINASGVMFVKLGQVLSTRRDVIPEPYLSALASLQSSASTLPWSEIERVIEQELGGPIDSVFASIDETPIAAASVAQVHAARLLDGTRVVIKVQRPTARSQVDADVDIMIRLARRAELHTRQGRELRAESLTRGFTSTLLDELDYRVEYRNTQMIRSTLALIGKHRSRDAVRIVAPSVHPQGSTRRLLTMDRVDGVPLSRADSVLAAMTSEQRDALASSLMSTVLEQILVHGVFHADLHPGNVIIRPDGSLGLIDFGAIGLIESSQRQHLAALLLATSGEDDVAATAALMLIVDVPPGLDLDGFRHDIGLALTTMRHRSGADGSIFTLMLDVIRQHHIALPPTLSSAFRSFATLEGCLHVLDPEFTLVTRSLSQVPTLMRRMLDPHRVAASVQAQALITTALARRLPERIDSITNQLEQGTLAVTLRSFATPGDQTFVGGLVSEAIKVLISLTGIVLAIVLLIADSGPQVTSQLTLFNLIGALVGFVSFLGILHALRSALIDRPRRARR